MQPISENNSKLLRKLNNRRITTRITASHPVVNCLIRACGEKWLRFWAAPYRMMNPDLYRQPVDRLTDWLTTRCTVFCHRRQPTCQFCCSRSSCSSSGRDRPTNHHVIVLWMHFQYSANCPCNQQRGINCFVPFNRKFFSNRLSMLSVNGPYDQSINRFSNVSTTDCWIP